MPGNYQSLILWLFRNNNEFKNFKYIKKKCYYIAVVFIIKFWTAYCNETFEVKKCHYPCKNHSK